MSNKKGVSLFEILTVIAIIIVISLITYISLRGYQQNQDLKNSTKTVISRLKLAQQYTVTEQIIYGIGINISDRNYELIRKGEPDEIVDSFLLEENVYFSSISGLEDDEVIFNPIGAVDYDGEIFLTHQETNHQTKIIIKPSGYVYWEYYQN